MESTHFGSEHNISSSNLPNFMPISPIVKCNLVTISGIPSPTTRRKGFLIRGRNIHSDSSLYSSVDSLLESRKPDPEEILINMSFSPVKSENVLSRIPKRFLKPSQVKGVDTEAFVRRLQLPSQLHDHSVLGYRGLSWTKSGYPTVVNCYQNNGTFRGERTQEISHINSSDHF